MGELANCSRCDSLYVSNGRNICQKCFQDEEKAFETVYKYMRKRINRQATIPQIMEATGVEELVVIKFVKEGRLRASQFPMLAYPCDKCGTDIAEGNLCEHCSAEFAADLRKQEEINQISQQNKVKEQGPNTYFTFDKTQK